MSEMDGARQWSPAPGLVWVAFEDSSQWVVYNPASSELHLLTDSARQLWLLASEGPARSAGALASLLTKQSELSESEMLKLTQDTLDIMDSSGLLRPAGRRE